MRKIKLRVAAGGDSELQVKRRRHPMKIERSIRREATTWEPQPWIPFPSRGPAATQEVLKPSDPLVVRIVWLLEEAPEPDTERD